MVPAACEQGPARHIQQHAEDCPLMATEGMTAAAIHNQPQLDSAVSASRNQEVATLPDTQCIIRHQVRSGEVSQCQDAIAVTPELLHQPATVRIPTASRAVIRAAEQASTGGQDPGRMS